MVVLINANSELPLGDVKLIQVGGGWRYGLVALLAAAIGAGAMAAATTFF